MMKATLSRGDDFLFAPRFRGEENVHAHDPSMPGRRGNFRRRGAAAA